MLKTVKGLKNGFLKRSLGFSKILAGAWIAFSSWFLRKIVHVDFFGAYTYNNLSVGRL